MNTTLRRIEIITSRSIILLAIYVTTTLTIGITLAPASAFDEAAQAYTWRNVVIKGGGFVTGITFHPAERDLIYARTDVGGVYRWDSSSNSWLSITDWVGRDIAHFMGVDSLAIDPSDPNQVYLVGGQYTQSWAANAAVLRSNDRGITWKTSNLSFKMGGNEDGRSNGERLAVDPNSGNILFLGTRNAGLWMSTDFASTWTRVSGFPVTTTANSTGIAFVQFVKSSGASGRPTPIIYVGVSQPGAHLYRSMDAGATWQAVAGQPSNVVPHQAKLDTAGTLYLTYGDRPGPNSVTRGAVWKYDTNNGTWTEITPPTGQGGFSGVSIDNQRLGGLVVTTIDRWYPRDQLYRSTDGGTTWTAVFNNASWDNSSAPWSVSRTPHWLGDVEIDPFDSSRVLFITGYGIWACDNLINADTGAVTDWVFRNDGLEETVPLGLISPPSGAQLLSVLGDIGGFRHDNLNASPPKPVHFTYATTNTCIDFAEERPEMIARVHGGTPRGSYSLDGGASWKDFATCPQPAVQVGPNGIALSANGRSLVWLPKGSIPYYSIDTGATWTPSNGGPKDPNSYQTMWPIADRVNSNKFYIYHVTEGNFYVSSDGGTNFSITAQVPKDGGIL
ncbi:MAG TPA: sialidase family protein, partial [Pyrinomonadaceae bacterium]|nr:sialidase family protein [Pyrinomonadaceae bacterium]